MGNYAISFQGYALVGSAAVLTPIDVPIQKKDRIEALKLLAKSLRRSTSISATLAYIKRRTKNSWVLTKIGNKKYPALVFLEKKEDIVRHEGDQLLINNIPHFHRISKDFEVILVYPD